jgi:hypothetical protein
MLKTPRAHNKQHRRWIASLPCCVTGRTGDDIHPHHIRYPDLKWGKRPLGKGETADDCWLVPLHWEVHDRFHRINDGPTEWAKIGIDPLWLAMALWRVSGNTELAEQILREWRPTNVVRS